MKNVLIVDPSPMFREFLKDKLTDEKISVTVVQEKRDAIIKITSMLPDLVIYELSEFDDLQSVTEIFTDIKKDPNASRIPLIATGPIYDKTTIALFAKLGVQKYFVKPVKFDLFFEAIGKILRTPFAIDTTPCVLDIHRNGNIIFIEIAQGLNREKISLLKYKLSEIIENNEIDSPKIILMMTNLELSFVDGLNLELLLDNILTNQKIHTKNIKVLSFSSFTSELIDGHPQYDGIEVATDISQFLNSLVDSTSTSRVSDLITDKILSSSENDAGSSIEMRFHTDLQSETEIELSQPEPEKAELKETPVNELTVAVVDDDAVILKLCASGFIQAGFKCDTYTSGIDFLANVSRKKYCAIILDILMPGISGFDTLKRLQGLTNKPPIIIYSQAVRKDIVVQALSLGAKSFLVKPQKPEAIVNKVQELLNGSI